MRFSLGAKFTLTVAIILIATMAANTFYFLGTAARFHEQQLVERGRALGHLISLISPDAILNFDFLLLNHYTREVSSGKKTWFMALSRRPRVRRSVFMSTTPMRGETNITAAERTDRSKLLQKLTSRDDLIQLKFPITHNNESLGNFLVGISRVSLESEFQRQLFIQLLVLTAIVLFLSLAIHIVFRINVLFPIRRLIAASEDVSRGRYTLVNAKSQDELGVLARAFNTMTDAIKREQAALHRQANFDALTGLPNRMMAFDRIKVEIIRHAPPHRRPVGREFCATLLLWHESACQR